MKQVGFEPGKIGYIIQIITIAESPEPQSQYIHATLTYREDREAMEYLLPHLAIAAQIRVDRLGKEQEIRERSELAKLKEKYENHPEV